MEAAARKEEGTMATKHSTTTSSAGNAGAQGRTLQDDVKDTAHRIWLAGLGALAAAEEEGTRLFSRLVDRGRDVESRGKVEVDKVVDQASKVVDKAKTRASDTWEDLGSKVDETITAALHRLGVPTREEIRHLTQRVEELNAKVELLRPRVTPATQAATAASAPKTVAAPKTAAAKPASKTASKVV
jgi:poly(hydroxyalkanoate) granule-associated protein